jgi:hypothetical protein
MTIIKITVWWDVKIVTNSIDANEHIRRTDFVSIIEIETIQFQTLGCDRFQRMFS